MLLIIFVSSSSSSMSIACSASTPTKGRSSLRRSSRPRCLGHKTEAETLLGDEPDARALDDGHDVAAFVDILQGASRPGLFPGLAAVQYVHLRNVAFGGDFMRNRGVGAVEVPLMEISVDLHVLDLGGRVGLSEPLLAVLGGLFDDAIVEEVHGFEEFRVANTQLQVEPGALGLLVAVQAEGYLAPRQLERWVRFLVGVRVQVHVLPSHGVLGWGLEDYIIEFKVGPVLDAHVNVGSIKKSWGWVGFCFLFLGLFIWKGVLNALSPQKIPARQKKKRCGWDNCTSTRRGSGKFASLP